MHDLGLLIPIVAITIWPVSRAVNNLIRARHGFEPEQWGSRRRGRHVIGATDLAAERQVMLLSTENEKLTGKISRLEERLAVLERIATDPAERTAREIEALRDR